MSSFSTRQDVVDFVDKQVAKHAQRIMDAVREDERDAKRKVELYDRISRHVGSFDHEGMSLQEMAAHAAKQLSLELDAGEDPVSAVKGYLKGREQTGTSASDRFWKGTQDSAPSGNAAFLDKYLKDGAA